jgi:hypothetical protein
MAASGSSALRPRAALLDEDSGARGMPGGGGLGAAAGLDPVTQRGGRGKPAAAHQLGRGRRHGGSALTGRWRRRHARLNRTAATRRRGAALTGDGLRCERGDIGSVMPKRRSARDDRSRSAMA